MDIRSHPDRQRIALVVQYVGTYFHGWQRQPEHRTVQAEIEAVLQQVLGYFVAVHAAGRTDAGVHAAAQIVHFDAVTLVPAHRWAAILNSRLPSDILILASASVQLDWHARFSATWRRYRYTVYNEPLPNLFARPFVWHYYQASLREDVIQQALDPLLGRHHLSAFHRANSSRKHSWLEVQEAICYRQGEFVYIEVQASGFLYGMMRLLVGLLVQVGQGSLSTASFTRIWQAELREQVKYAAPPQGLCLLRVGYPNSPFPEKVCQDAQPRFRFG